jgi:UDP-glucuronate 4-epimerase
MDFIGLMEQAFGKVAEKEFLPMQPGDVKATYADTQALEDWVGFKPSTSLKAGVQLFADWYKKYSVN